MIDIDEMAMSMASKIAKLEEERDRLREAIETHRRNKWGEGGGVGHYEDVRLYDALQEAGDA